MVQTSSKGPSAKDLERARKLLEQALALLDPPMDHTGGNSDGVAASWDDPEIAAKRKRRWACVVDGEVFSSVGEACDTLDYTPREGHIAWRGELVRAIDEQHANPFRRDTEGRNWIVVERTGNPNWRAEIKAMWGS